MKMLRKNWLWVLVVAIIVGKWIIDDSPSGSSGGSSSDLPPEVASRLQDANNQAGANAVWPPQTDDTITLAGNLLTTNYYFVLDGSGSMNDQGCSGNQSKLAVAKDAAAKFADKIPADANVGVTAFDTFGIGVRQPLSPFNKSAFVNAVNTISAGGGTPLGSAMLTGYDALTEQASKQLGYGEYHLVVVTDGAANRDDPTDPVVEIVVNNSPVIIHVIGFCIGSDHALNKAGVTLYTAADNSAALAAGLESVLAESEDFDVSNF